MKNENVAEYFCTRESGAGSNFTTNGDSAWSYNTVIAKWHGSSIIVTTKKYSPTTSRHVNLIINTAKEYNINVSRGEF